MGRGMCKNLVEKGQLERPLIIFNRTTKRAEYLNKSLPSGKSIIASSIQEAVSKADIIFTCVGDDTAINETFDAALQGKPQGKLFVDCSTEHPDTTNALAKKVIDAGSEFVAAPVFGAPAAADGGQLICLLAGPETAVEKVKPYTKGVMGKAIIDFPGQGYEKASMLKLVGNTIIINMVESIAESQVLAEKIGLGTKNLHRYIEAIFGGTPYPAYSTRMLSGDYHKREEPLFAVDLARKDARHVKALAESVGARMKDIEVADAHLAQVKEHAGASGDLAGIYAAVRQEAGLKFENE